MASANLNTQVLAELTQLADTLARLDERGSSSSYQATVVKTEPCQQDKAVEEITSDAATLSLSDTKTNQISHYRTQPPPIIEAYTLLTTGSQYIHAASTKYTLVSKIDYQTQGGQLALELQKGANLIANATLSIFSSGCGRSAKKYVKQFSRGVIASVISLIQAFEDGSALEGKNNQIGPQKTGAVWSACDAIQSLPKGNRNCMRRECMVWIRDCMESSVEFEEIMKLGEREDGDEEELTYDEEMYSSKEMGIVKSAVNIMKCSKNVLGLVLKACDCVGDCIEKLNGNSAQDSITQNHIPEMLQWISEVHEQARSIGEGVTDFGILLYPPLDLGVASESTLAQRLNHQLQSLEECVCCISDATTPITKVSMSCMSDEVMEGVERLRKGVEARKAEVKSALS